MRFLDALIADWNIAREENHRVKLQQLSSGAHGELLAIRLKGKLPHIDINGTDFTIDWRLKELRETECPWNRISLERLDRTKPGGGFAFLYHTNDHNIFQPEERIFSLPENVVLVELPNEQILDPI